jgi:hypothetical protein
MSETQLGRAIVAQAFVDACSPHERGLPVTNDNHAAHRDLARTWLSRRSRDLDTVCALGDLDTDAVLSVAQRLARRGWPTTALVVFHAGAVPQRTAASD